MEKELLLLGILRRQELHGYRLAEFIEHNLGSCTDLKKSTAYYLLEKLAAAGWVAFTQDQAGKRPARRVYRLTETGEAAFQRLLRQHLAAFTSPYFTDDIPLAFMDLLPPAEALALLEERRAAAAEHLAQLRAAPAHPGPAQWMVAHQIRFLENELLWLQELEEHLQSPSTDPTPLSE